MSKKTNLLVIRGVRAKDLSGSRQVEARAKGSAADIYTVIPKMFTSPRDWPQASNLRCWNCDQLPLSYPKFVPDNLRRNPAGNIICDTVGNFCEWNCVVRYIITEIPSDRRTDLLDSVCIIEHLFSGVRKVVIPPAPPKTLMQSYSGRTGLTPAEWRRRLAEINNRYSLIEPVRE